MAENKLTARQLQFAQEYLVDRNAEQAAIRAGYSAKYARGNAYKLVADRGIAAEIQRLGQETANKLEITRERIAQELASIAFANAADFVVVEDVSSSQLAIHPLTGEILSLPGIGQRVRVLGTAELPEEKKAALAAIKQGANGIEVKTYDKTKALELLGKMLGMFEGREAQETPKNNLRPSPTLCKLLERCRMEARKRRRKGWEEGTEARRRTHGGQKSVSCCR